VPNLNNHYIDSLIYSDNSNHFKACPIIMAEALKRLWRLSNQNIFQIECIVNHLYSESLPPFVRRINGLIFLFDLMNREVLVRPVGLVRFNMGDSEGVRVLIESVTTTQPTHYQVHYILQIQTCTVHGTPKL